MTVSPAAGCFAQTVPVWRSVSAVRLDSADAEPCGRDVAEETPLAIRYNGMPYAVMMGTPLDLEDFAVGFSVAEGIARHLEDFRFIATQHHDDGIQIDISLAPQALHGFLARRRVRSLRGNTSCGICGIEELDQIACAPTPRVRAAAPIGRVALHAALEGLRGLQPLSSRTHGAHAAAWVDRDGALLLVREDVGRHNALDKLVGAARRDGHDLGDGFCLITSRCSYEMAQKAIAGGIAALVAISAPTALAIRTAQAAGLTLLTLDRSGGHLIYAAPDGGSQQLASQQSKHREEHQGACP